MQSLLYIAYLVYTGKEFDPNQLNEVGKKAKEIINDSKESIEETIDKKKKDAVDSILDGN